MSCHEPRAERFVRFFSSSRKGIFNVVATHDRFAHRTHEYLFSRSFVGPIIRLLDDAFLFSSQPACEPLR